MVNNMMEHIGIPDETIFNGGDNITVLPNISQLNQQQRLIFDMVIHAVETSNSLCIFVDGPGGTGKTFLYTTLLSYVRSNNKVALPVASSGVAAALLPGGRTAHNRFKLPLTIDEHMQCSVTKQSSLAALLRQAALFIWDEAPMLHKYCFEAVDRLMRDVTGIDKPFGGKVFVLGGDFRQVLPVIPRADKEAICNSTIVNSYLWSALVKQRLTHNMRAFADEDYAAYVLQVGNGELCSEPSQTLEIPNRFIIHGHDESSSILTLVGIVYPDIANWPTLFENYKNRVLLTPKNETVDALNEILIGMLPGQQHVYYSFDEGLDTTDKTFEVDFLNMLNPSGLPPHELRLKPDCPLILLRNLSAADGLCNGTRLIAKRFLPNLIQAEISTGDRAGQIVFIPRITFLPPESQEHALAFKRTQYPVKLCFAMTLNKAQGQTLDFVGLFLKDHVFAHGQLYVGLSRVRDSSSIKVVISSKDDELPHGNTRNIVYKNLLHQI